MKLIYNKIFLEHDTGIHPENKSRLESLGKLPETNIENGEKYLELVHTKEHINQVKQACETESSLDPDTITSKKSYEAAIYAVGATVMASQSNDFALVRPPGHHAYPDHASGFCLFNNIAIATQKLINEGKKILIFDFDGHCGDGTMNTFYKSDKVLYWSLHQSPAYPGYGNINEIGESKGKGYTINIPLPPGTGDDLYLKAINQFMPIAEQFRPDIVAVSAGFDGHKDDPLLNLRLTYNTYYQIGKILNQKFKNIFAALEGGYNIQILPKCIFSFIEGINNKEIRFKEERTESSNNLINEFELRINQLNKNLSQYWKL
jgi:acetoin utilization deacetylase AcuC-like enzyme